MRRIFQSLNLWLPGEAAVVVVVAADSKNDNHEDSWQRRRSEPKQQRSHCALFVVLSFEKFIIFVEFQIADLSICTDRRFR